jgi:putative membrane protein
VVKADSCAWLSPIADCCPNVLPMSEFGTSPKPGKRISGRGIAALIILVVAIIFMAQNTDTVNVTFLFLDLALPLWLVILVVFILGMLLGGAVRTGFRKLRGAEPKTKKQ